MTDIASFLPQFILLLIIVGMTILIQSKRKQLTKAETYLRISLFSFSIFFVANSFLQSIQQYTIKTIPGFFELTQFPNLPNYLVFLATAISAYFLYTTLNTTKRANQIASFENRFFKFIDYHRENVSQLKYRDPKLDESHYWEGNQVFTIIYYEIKELIVEFLKHSKFSEADYLKKRDCIDFIYQCVFYGAGEDGLKILKKRFSEKGYLKHISFEKKYAKYSIDGKHPVYYSGHVRRLGHYFRNIYQAIKYVEKQDFLTPDEKYEYVSHFRAQLSVHEQSVFFFNSLSELGESWEWQNYSMEYPQNKETRRAVFNKLLITKYDFIRNILADDDFILNNISIKDFYPLINLERSDECSVSGALPFKNSSKQICRFCFNKKYIGNDNGDEKSKIEASIKHNPEIWNTFACEEEKCLANSLRNKMIPNKS